MQREQLEKLLNSVTRLVGNAEFVDAMCQEVYQVACDRMHTQTRARARAHTHTQLRYMVVQSSLCVRAQLRVSSNKSLIYDAGQADELTTPEDSARREDRAGR
jgi:hypothetical protein